MCEFLTTFDYNKPLSLYIHVPFCNSKCSYCAFFSVAGYQNDVKKRYVNKLLLELKEVVSRMNGKPFETAYIGGGNPGCLDIESLQELASLVCLNGRPKEFTVEMNPESLKSEMKSLFDCFFTRLSIGVQSLDPKALSFLGRNATLQETYQGLELSQKISMETGCELSYDMITCLGSWHNHIADISLLCNNFPTNHMSVYALTLEEGTPLFKRNPTLPNDDLQSNILESVWSFLEAKGFEHYEVSNFAKNAKNAKNSKRGLHNCRYWAYKPYIGLGPGAASTGFNNGTVYRGETKKSVLTYISSPLFSNIECEKLSKNEALEEFVLMGLRYKGGLDLTRLERDFGYKLSNNLLKNVMRNLDGFYIENAHLVPSDKGLLVADYAALEVLKALQV